MKAEELDYRGVLPFDNEDRKTYINRGEQFLEDAYDLKDILKKDARTIMKENKILKEKWYHIRDIKDGECKFVEGNNEFFEHVYRTNLDWVSVIEAECIGYGGFKKNIKFKKTKMPISIVNSGYETESQWHEKIHCMREPISDYLKSSLFSHPWKEYEGSPEENLTMGLSNTEWNHPLMKNEKEDSCINLLVGGGIIAASFISPISYFVPLAVTAGALNFTKAYRLYNSYKNTVPTKIAFEKILKSEEPYSYIKQDVQYSLLRLKTPEIREIGKQMEKNNIKSGKTAIIEFTKKRKNLRSEIILENIS